MADRTLIPGNWRTDGARPFLHRAVVLITGQGDELATPFAGCTGGCQQGDQPCDCELACDVAPDADRVIAPPPPLPDDMRARMNRKATVIGVVLFALLAALVGISDPRFTP